jgi:hypothetical protein
MTIELILLLILYGFFIYYINTMEDRSIDYAKLEGYRKVGTKVGSWDGAWVYIPRRNQTGISAFFEDGEEYVILLDVYNQEEVDADRHRCIEKGWKPMSYQDIWFTSRIRS